MSRADGRSLRVGLKRVDIQAVLSDFAYVVNTLVVGVLTEREEEKHSHVLLVVLFAVHGDYFSAVIVRSHHV